MRNAESRVLTLVLSLLLLGLPGSAAAKKVGDLIFVPHTFEAASGEKAAAELGRLVVPASRRSGAGPATLDLVFVRFKSTASQPGPPIVFLAGGPGGEGIESLRGDKFALVTALRGTADVIALDQRGTGRSSDFFASCREAWMFPIDRPGDHASLVGVTRTHAEACAAFLARNQVDLATYTLAESADDLESLRAALGAPKLSLLGISYGTHLALEAVRRHPQSFSRLVLAGVEGPGQRLQLPSQAERLLGEIDRRVQADPALRAAIPSFPDLVRALLERLDKEPVTLPVADVLAEREVPVTAGRFDLQMMIAQALGQKETWRRLPAQLQSMARGDFSQLADFVYRRRKGWLGPAMPYLVTCSDGLSPERRQRIQAEAEKSLLGRAIDFPFPDICEGWGVTRAGAESWAPVRSETPALFISGTLDTRTPPENAEEVGRGFPNGRHLLIEEAGHGDDLLVATPEIGAEIVRFLAGQEPTRRRITLPAVRLEPITPVKASSPAGAAGGQALH